MSKVNEAKQAQRLEQQRTQQQKTKQEMQQSADKFNKALGQKKAEKGETNKSDNLQKNKNVQKQTGKSAMMARSGIAMANKFQGMLGTRGKQSLDQGSEAVKSRGGDMKEKEVEAKEADAKESLREAQQDADRVEGINYERGGGQGGGGSMGGGGGDSGQDGNMQGQGGIAAAGGMAEASGPAQAQGAAGPQIPAHILQEIVKRVLVGVDKEGMSNFVIQFKDDVLGGATMQISAKDGKISAKFTTGDKNAGRLLKASEGALARAFAQKGMSLESLTVEAR